MERTLKELQKDKRKLKTAAMTDEGLNSATNKECAAEICKEQNTMEDLWKSFIQDKYLAVRQPAIDVNDFELKPALIRMVQQNQFTGHSTENPNEHLGRFLRIANSIKLNGVRSEVIQLELFPFSLRGMAAAWFNSLPYESVNTWEELMGVYFSKFFSLFRISEQGREIKRSTRGNVGDVALKLDISKAYDRVDWKFLHHMLRVLRFDDRWIKWIMMCVTSARYFVLVNGSEVGPIIPK